MLKKGIVVAFLLSILLVVWKWDAIKGFLNKSERSTNTSEVKLLLREEPDLQKLAEILKSESIIEDEADFIEFAQSNGMSSNFAAGKYVILPGTKLSDLLIGFQKASNGHGNAEVKVNVVFNRCRDIHDMASQISKCILADSSSIVSYCQSAEALNKYSFTLEQLPALFIPATYEMYFDLSAEDFVAEMASIFRDYWTEDRISKMTSIGFTSPSQVVTLASIVYSEQGRVPEEWSTIAGLYRNRLRVGMKLQSDPTFKFCWGKQLDGVQRLLAKHRQIDCPYNTYKYEGLPPGPICLVPSEVVDAVLDSKSTNYLYMCAKTDNSGRHNFTASDHEHMRNAREYQRWLSNR